MGSPWFMNLTDIGRKCEFWRVYYRLGPAKMNQTLKIVIGGVGVLAVLCLLGLGIVSLATNVSPESSGVLRDDDVFRIAAIALTCCG